MAPQVEIIVVMQTLLFITAFIFARNARSVSQPSTRPPAEGAGMFLTTLLEPFQFDFMVNALMVSVIVAIPCALLSTFSVKGWWALMGDAMSHAVFPGVVLAYIVGIPTAIGASLPDYFALSRPAIWTITTASNVLMMGIVFFRLFGAGLVLLCFYSISRRVIWITSCLGNYAGRIAGDIVHKVGCTGYCVNHRAEMGKRSPCHALTRTGQPAGWSLTLLHYGLLCMIALTIIATLKSVGIILSISLLIAPRRNCHLLTRRFARAGIAVRSVEVITAFAGVCICLLS
ncbi:metal ABC transporter permease [Salmonella enterica subsp. enterica]|nr:metal ABC transporter permease [Salmonella enterica subsp. enterica]